MSQLFRCSFCKITSMNFILSTAVNKKRSVIKFKKTILQSAFLILTIIVTIFVIFIVYNTSSLAMGQNKKPTAIILDAETGEPVEGAVAIAIWRKHSMFEGAWFEGRGLKVLKIKEAVSDKQGRIFISGFWSWHISKDRYPNLTVYKPSYVCWDQWAGYYELVSGPVIMNWKVKKKR